MDKIRDAVRAGCNRSWASRGLAVWLALLVMTAGLGGIAVVSPDKSAVGDATARNVATTAVSGDTVYTGSGDYTVKAIDASTGSAIWTFSGHTNIVYDVAVGPDEQQVYSASIDNTLKAIDAGTGSAVWTFTGHSDQVRGVAVSADGSTVYTASADGTVRAIDASTGSQIWSYSTGATQATGISAGPNNARVYSGDSSNVVTAIDATDGTSIWTFTGHTGGVNAVSAGPNGDEVYSGASDNTVRAIDASTGSQIWSFTGHSNYVDDVQVGPDGANVYSGSYDNTVKAIDTSTGSAVWTFTGHSNSVRSVSANPAGDTVYSGAADNTAKAIDASTGSAIWTFSGHTGTVFGASGGAAVAYGPDKYNVSGTVTDTDGVPISGATVSDGNGNSTTTDANGDWKMSLINDTTYTLTASQTGYTPNSQDVTVSGSPVTGVNYSLVGQLRGWVRNGENDNSPISGATVETSGGTSDTTNSTGFYSLPLTDGTYTVTADHPDFTAFQDDITVGGATAYNYTLCKTGCTSTGGEVGYKYDQTFVLEDYSGQFYGHSPSLFVYELAEGTSISDVSGGPADDPHSWDYVETYGFNHDNESYATLTDSQYYSLIVVNEDATTIDQYGDSASWVGYQANGSSGPTTLQIGDENTDDLLPSGGSSSGGGGSGSTSTWTPYPDGSTHTATPADGYGPTIVGDCRMDGQDGIRIEYYDPSGGTYELDYSLTDDSGTLYEGSKMFDGGIGYFWGCVLDSVSNNASESTTDVNWTARDDTGAVIDSGSQNAVSAPVFGPTGNAPDSTAERVGLLGSVLALLGALWFGGRKYAPAEQFEWWPVAGVSPAFAIGAPIVTLIGLDISGGGVLSAALAFGVSRVAPLAMIAGVGLAAYYAWVWIQPG